MGLLNAELDITWACDFDPHCVKTYSHNVGEWVVQADITKLAYADIPKADGWAFGFPCQDLSVAGKQAGFVFRCVDCGTEWKHESEAFHPVCPNCNGTNFSAVTRSACFFEIMRLLDETKEHAPENYPKFLLAENVKGLRPYIPTLIEELEKRGYNAKVQLYNSMYWDVAQNRERYFIVATLKCYGEFIFPEEQHEYIPKLSTALDAYVDPKYYIPDDRAKTILEQAALRLEEIKDLHPCITPDRINKRQNGRRAKENEDPMFTLTAQDIHGVIISEEMEASLKEKKPQIMVIGTLDIAGYDHGKRVHDTEGISPTLTAVAGGTHHIKILDRRVIKVRKLTPTEYGRLQGFPVDDGWEQVVSDSQAYKQYGNAVTTTIVKAIGEAIKSFLDRYVQPEEVMDFSDIAPEDKATIIANAERLEARDEQNAGPGPAPTTKSSGLEFFSNEELLAELNRRMAAHA